MHFIPLLVLADGGDTACGKTGSTRTDEFGEAADELEFGLGAIEAELLLEEIVCVLQVLESVLLN